MLSTYLGGYIVTATKSYDMALIVFAVIIALAGVAVCPTIKRSVPQA